MAQLDEQLAKALKELREAKKQFEEATDKADAFDIANDLIRKKLPAFLSEAEYRLDEHAQWEYEGYVS